METGAAKRVAAAEEGDGIIEDVEADGAFVVGIGWVEEDCCWMTHSIGFVCFGV